jgi:hypothetical protein
MIGIMIGYNAKDFDMEEQNILTQENKNASALLNVEKSPLLDDITVRLRGEVVKIDENSLLIKKGEDSFEAKIGDFSLRIIKVIYEPDGSRKPAGEDLQLKDVKIGDELRIRCVLEEGIWQLEDIVIEQGFSESQG